MIKSTYLQEEAEEDIMNPNHLQAAAAAAARSK
jgi:hypothetical protein